MGRGAPPPEADGGPEDAEIGQRRGQDGPERVSQTHQPEGAPSLQDGHGEPPARREMKRLESLEPDAGLLPDSLQVGNVQDEDPIAGGGVRQARVLDHPPDPPAPLIPPADHGRLSGPGRVGKIADPGQARMLSSPSRVQEKGTAETVDLGIEEIGRDEARQRGLCGFIK